MSARRPRTRPAAGADPSIGHVLVGVLGLLTIVSYGTWYYSFGVLLDPIRLDTGWTESTLALSFAAGTVIMGIGSVLGGRLLDRVGPRVVFLVAAVGGGSALAVTSLATEVWLFAAASAIASGFLGSLGFYHITMSTAVRLNPHAPARAIAVLTIWGAFASFIYLPTSAFLLQRFDWRVVVRLLALAAVLMFVVAAAFMPRGGGPPPERPVPLWSVLRATVATADRRALSGAVALGGIAISTVLVYQVPAMTAAGLPLATAATVAGIRGFCQIGGRIPLTPLVARLGSTGALVLAFTAMSVGGIILAVAGTVAIGLLFAAVTGFGIGAFSPLQGIKAEELYDRDTLGATMGYHGTVLMLAGALGPAVAGTLADATDDRRVAAAVVALSAAGAAALASRLRGPRLRSGALPV